MLVKYNKSFEKIAMGLLSYMPHEKDLKVIQQTLRNYEELDEMHLYFWNEQADKIGIIGIKEVNDTVIVQHLALNPSYRHQGIGQQMVLHLKKMYPNKKIIGSEATANFIKSIHLN